MINREAIIKDMARLGLRLALAESCTGGMLAAAITDISGASEIFELGMVSYSKRIKEQLLGIPPHVIPTFGVYSLECANEMSRAAREKAQADIGIGITGVAGPYPDEGTEAGRIFISLSHKDGFLNAVTDPLPTPDRHLSREGAVEAAFQLLRQHLDDITPERRAPDEG